MASDEVFNKAFRSACYAGELPKIQEAIASERLTTENLERGLALATEKAHSDIVAALFDAGAQVTAYVVDFLTGDHLQPGLVRQSLDHGLDPNSKLSNSEPLLNFLVDPACARELLTRGADPNVSGPCTKSPLYNAIMGGRASLSELLLAYGAKLDPDLLFVTAAPRRQYGELMTKFLLDKGLDPNPISAEWGTPLHLAVYAGKPNIVKLLLDAGADPTTQSAASTRHYPGQTPSQIAQTLSHLRSPDITQAMLSLLQS